MSTVDDITAGVLTRLEETNPPVFWSLDELRLMVVEGMCEATVLTGIPQFRQVSTPVTLTANTTFFSNPANAFALLRMEIAGQPVRKCSIWDMDMDHQNWQNDVKQATPNEWMPTGLSGFAIHPQLTAPVQAIMTVVQNPVTTAPPYTGNEVLPYQSEFNIGFEMYAAHVARLKEGGAEFDSGMFLYEGFLSVMAELSLFGLRVDSLRFSKTVGTQSRVDPVEKK